MKRSLHWATGYIILPALYMHEKINQILADRTVANSSAGLKIFHLRKSKKNRVIHNGFDQNRLNAAKPAQIREQLKQKGALLVAMTANFTLPKDFRTLIEAGKKILADRRNLCSFFSGVGLERPSMQQLI